MNLLATLKRLLKPNPNHPTTQPPPPQPAIQIENVITGYHHLQPSPHPNQLISSLTLTYPGQYSIQHARVFRQTSPDDLPVRINIFELYLN